MEYFGFWGIISFVIILTYSSYPKKVKLLENKVKKIERNREEEYAMSKIILGLVGRKCRILFDWEISVAKEYEVLEVDEEWATLSSTDKKGTAKTTIIRIDSIKSVELLNE